MPDHHFDQKSRDDLVIVAKLAALRAPEELERLSKPLISGFAS